MKLKFLILTVILLMAFACTDDENTGAVDDDQDTVTEVPDLFKRFSDNVTVYLEEINGETFVVIETDDVPNHSSPYFDPSDSRFEAYNGNNPDFNINPNEIIEQNIIFKIPLEPVAAVNPEATRLGPIGVSLNGVVFYNQYAGPNNQPLTDEINSFDQYLGHPQGQGQYHYHLEPLYLTETLGSGALLGWLLDGFPVYGPIEDGDLVTNDDLDEYHGHEHTTSDYPDGTYHYHITDADP